MEHNIASLYQPISRTDSLKFIKPIQPILSVKAPIQLYWIYLIIFVVA